METRGFVIRNFRNIGLCEGRKSQEAFLRLSELGGLTILIGKHGSNKSNVLIALKKFSDLYLYLENSQEFEGMQLLSQDDIPKLPSEVTAIGLACREHAYYLHYPQEIAPKSGEAQKKKQMGESFDLDKHLEKLQDDFDNFDIYFERNENEMIKLLLKDSSSGGRFMRCKKEPLENIDDRSVDDLNVVSSEKLDCSFIVGHKALDVKQNFADYINDPSQQIESSVVKEYGHSICLKNDKKLHREYYSVCMNEGNENAFLYRHIRESPGKKHQQLHIPHIVFYEEVNFYDKLSTMSDEIKNRITKKIVQLNQDFSTLYGTQEGEEGYRFEPDNKKDAFALEIYSGEQLLSLEEQGSGFRKLFNFVFSLTQQIDSLQKGDIVLIDDVGESLSFSVQKRLRKYLKELAQKRGILFIVSTHSPFMIDRDCPDEIRLLEPKRNGRGMEIVDFKDLDETSRKNVLADILGMDCCNAPKPANGNGIEA